jgi:hypothetical protein
MDLLYRLSPDEGDFFDLSQLSCARVGNNKKNGLHSKEKLCILGTSAQSIRVIRHKAQHNYNSEEILT